MDITQTIALALIQGLTEFLPVSSSAHLVILPKFLDWPDQGLAFDVVLHFATLCAIVYYYRLTLVEMSKDFACSIVTRKMQGQSMLAWAVLLGTIPVGFTGLFFKDSIELNLRSYEVVAFATIFFGFLLGFSDWLHRFLGRSREFIRSSDILIVGTLSSFSFNSWYISLRNNYYCSTINWIIKITIDKVCISSINPSNSTSNPFKNF